MLFREPEPVKRIRFTIPGKPVAKGRPRVGKGYTYTPKKTVQGQDFARNAFLERAAPELPGGRPWEGPVQLYIRSFYPAPKSRPKWWKALLPLPKTTYPDGDNLYKLIADALNSVAYADDRQIWRGIYESWYHDGPAETAVVLSLYPEPTEDKS